MHLEIVLPQIPQIFTDFIYPRIRVHLCYLWEILSHPISVLICDICGSHPLLLEIVPPTDSTDFHRCILRLFSHRFHRYSQILYIPESVLLCAICGRFFRTQYLCSSAISVGDSLCYLRFILPRIADFHRFYISQYPCSSVLSVGNSFAPDIRVHLRYLWEPSSAS